MHSGGQCVPADRHCQLLCLALFVLTFQMSSSQNPEAGPAPTNYESNSRWIGLATEPEKFKSMTGEVDPAFSGAHWAIVAPFLCSVAGGVLCDDGTE